MKSLQEIISPLDSDLKNFKAAYAETLKSDSYLLDKIVKYVLSQRGKQIRPALVLLSAKLCGEINPKTHEGAILVELMHTATLIHDDVVDDADMRRGLASINALWKNKVAVLLGDYLLSRGLLVALDGNSFEMLKVLSRAVKQMSEGELLQIEKTRRLNLTEEIYYKIINAKTASLISSACEIGALSTTTDENKRQLLREIGEGLGMAFQIRDDLFDYISDAGATGKPVGLDVKEKKLTLPIIHALSNGTPKEVRYIKELISSHKKAKEFEIIKDFVFDKGGIDYAMKISENYANEALEKLSTFPETESRQIFEQIIEFVIRRKN